MIHHFICDYVEDETAKIQFVWSEETWKVHLNRLHQGTYTVINIWKIHYPYFNHVESNHRTQLKKGVRV